MIKLIACDIDGTLIPYGQTSLPQGLFPLVNALNEKGILFCPASGRQYHSLRGLFATVAHRAYFICENGAAVFGPSEAEETAPLLSKTAFPHSEALALCRDIMACPEGDVFISGQNTTYVCGCGEALIRHTETILGNRIQEVRDPADIPEDIIKISAYCPGGIADTFTRLEKWGKVFRMAEAGPMWVDFTLSDKGTGILALCRALGVDPCDVAAIGDNWNDLAMLQAVGHPYLMSCADPKLKELIPRHCDDPLQVMGAILEGKAL